ncbi:hypothetical protein Tco_0613805 [Tanacetum coccineum]
MVSDRRAVMSSSTVTYTSICSDYHEPSDAGSPRVVFYGYDGLPMHPVYPYVETALLAPGQAPPSPNYVTGPEHPPSPDYVPGPREPEQAPLSPVYVHEPEYPEYLVLSDAEAPMEDQPLPDDASPTTLSPSYDADFDPEEDLEEDPEEDPADYLVDGGDDDDDDDVDEDEEDEEDKEEEEHLALADSSVIPVDDLDVCPNPDTYTIPSEAEVARLLALPTPPPSLLTPLSSPLPHIPSPPLPLPSPPTTSPTYAKAPLGYRAAGIRFEVGESSSAAATRQAGHTLAHRVDYGFLDTVDASIRAVESRAMTAVGVVNDRVTNLATTQRQDAQELYLRCEDVQDDRALLGAQALSHSESRIQAMEAQIRALQRDIDVLQRQRIKDEDRLTSHIQHDHDRFRDLVRVAEAGPQDRPEDAGSSCYYLVWHAKYYGSLPASISLGPYSHFVSHCTDHVKMPPKKRITTTTTTTPMTDAQLKALIAQGVADALAEIEANRTSRNGNDNHDSGTSSGRT